MFEVHEMGRVNSLTENDEGGNSTGRTIWKEGTARGTHLHEGNGSEVDSVGDVTHSPDGGNARTAELIHLHCPRLLVQLNAHLPREVFLVALLLTIHKVPLLSLAVQARGNLMISNMTWPFPGLPRCDLHLSIKKLYSPGCEIWGLPEMSGAPKNCRGGKSSSITSSQPRLRVLGLRPVAIRTWSRPWRTTWPSVLLSATSVSFPSSPLRISTGLAAGCRCSPCTPYCSATKLRTSSSKPRSGSGCAQIATRRNFSTVQRSSQHAQHTGCRMDRSLSTLVQICTSDTYMLQVV